jgi:hypothetical protein
MVLRKCIFAKQDGGWMELAELLRLVAVIHRVPNERWDFLGIVE